MGLLAVDLQRRRVGGFGGGWRLASPDALQSLTADLRGNVAHDEV